jgi:hypothetical protein
MMQIANQLVFCVLSASGVAIAGAVAGYLLGRWSVSAKHLTDEIHLWYDMAEEANTIADEANERIEQSNRTGQAVLESMGLGKRP